MKRLNRVVLAIVGIIVTAASSALPVTMSTVSSATPRTVLSANSDTLAGVDVTHLIGGSPASTPTPTTSPTTSAATAAQPAASAVDDGTQKVYVEVVSATATSGDDVNSISQADAKALVGAMNTYWSGESAGAVAISFAGYETSSLNASSCDPDSIYSSVPANAFGKQFAHEAWKGTGKHLLILTTESCAGDGQGSVGGNGGIMLSGNGAGASLGQPIAFHEFGHNLGFGHAGSSMCRSNVTEDGSVSDFGDASSLCPTDEYGDFLDIMGYSIAGSAPHLSTPERIHLGWMSDYTTITNAVPTTTTTVTSLDGPAANRALRIIDPTTGAAYDVEYRTASGADAASTEFTGEQACQVNSGYTSCGRGVSAATGSVRILRELPFRGSSSYLRTVVLAVGSTGTDTMRMTHFGIGDTFATSGGVYITLNSASASSGASVTVRFSPPASTSTAVALTASTQAFGTRTQAVVQAQVSTADGSPASGTITFQDGDTVIGYGAVTNGGASLAVGSTLAIGTHRISARYTPATGDLAASSGNVAKLVVTKQKSAITVKVAHHKATVKLAVAGTTVKKGTLRVYANGHLVKKVSLKRASVTVKLPKKATKVTVKYAGSKLVAAATATKKL